MITQTQPARSHNLITVGCYTDWCPEDDTRHNVRARRNVLFALWAGKMMDLSPAKLSRYPFEVHLADFCTTGDDDVVAKVAADLECAGLSICRTSITAKLASLHRDALAQIQVTD